MVNLPWPDEMSGVPLCLDIITWNQLYEYLKGYYCVKCYALSTALIPTTGKLSPIKGCSLALKGLCHEMKYFLKVLRIKSLLSLYTLIVFKFFCCLVMEKLKDKVLFGLLLWKHLLIVKILPVTLYKLNCLLRPTGTRPWVCKLCRKLEMILKRVTVFLFLTAGWLAVVIFKGWTEAHNPFELPQVPLVGGGGGGGGILIRFPVKYP